jgi:ribonuclease PH
MPALSRSIGSSEPALTADMHKPYRANLGAEKQLTEMIDVAGAIEEVVHAVGKKPRPQQPAPGTHSLPSHFHAEALANRPALRRSGFGANSGSIRAHRCGRDRRLAAWGTGTQRRLARRFHRKQYRSSVRPSIRFFREVQPMRPSKRKPDELRRVSIERAVSMHAEGSCLIKFGNTHVHCTASLEERMPPWLKGQGRGWVTAEYGMLPRATTDRTRREATAGHPSGRTQEIQRLIGRALRAVVDLPKLGERQISIDCDVIQADGGTRTAAITGAWVALHDCLKWMQARDMVREGVLRDHVAAVSCGLYKGTAVLDLDYPEDSGADADANFVMTGSGGIVEVQGTAETVPFTQEGFDQLMALARKGIAELIELQKLTVA